MPSCAVSVVLIVLALDSLLPLVLRSSIGPCFIFFLQTFRTKHTSLEKANGKFLQDSHTETGWDKWASQEGWGWGVKKITGLPQRQFLHNFMP